MTQNMDFMKKVALLMSAWKSRGVAWSYNFEESWNMLGGGWISNIIFISFLERKGGRKKKNPAPIPLPEITIFKYCPCGQPGK